MADFPYIELPGTFRGLVRKSSLWEGVDHLLLVRGTRYSEQYRRFYFQDIQSFIIEKRARAGSIGVWMLLLFILLILVFWTVTTDSKFFGPLVAVVSAAILVRLYLSAFSSCRCSIQTAVSREQLPSLIRLSDARKVASRLRERVLAVQGELGGDIPLSEEQALAAIIPPSLDAPSPAEAFEKAFAAQKRKNALVAVNSGIAAFSAMLLSCLLTLWFAGVLGGRFADQSPEARLYLVSWCLLAVMLFVGRYIPKAKSLRGLRAFWIFALVFCCLRLVTSFILQPIYYSLIRNRPNEFNSLQVYPRTYCNIDAALQFAVAAAGLLLIVVKWNSYRRGES